MRRVRCHRRRRLLLLGVLMLTLLLRHGVPELLC